MILAMRYGCVLAGQSLRGAAVLPTQYSVHHCSPVPGRHAVTNLVEGYRPGLELGCGDSRQASVLVGKG